MAPRLGAGGLTVDCAPEQHASWQPSQWRPGGYDTSVDLAAVSVAYHTATFASLLHFLDGWEACKLAPWGWRTPRPPQSARQAAPGSGSGSRSSAVRPAVLPLPYSPEPVAEMVLQSFSAHGTPVLGMLCLQGGSLELHCPGIAVQLPYNHHAQFDMVRMRESAGIGGGGGTAADKPGAAAGSGAQLPRSSSTPADPAAAADPFAAIGQAVAEGELGPPLRYALTLVVQDIRLTVTGEDASGCLQVRWQPGSLAGSERELWSQCVLPGPRSVGACLLPP